MTQARIGGLPGPTRVKRPKGVPTADDLVKRKFHRSRVNELWLTDITEHPTREGKVFCAAVLDVYSRKIVGWVIDSKQDSTLVVNALDMAIRSPARHSQEGLFTPTMASNSRPGYSLRRFAQRVFCHRLGPLVTG